MDRKEFVKMLGIRASAAVAVQCYSGCKNENQGIVGPTNVDFTLHLDDFADSALDSVGGYVVHSGVIVAHTSGDFVAVSVACTHQGTSVYYDSSSNLFVCPAHGSRFSTGGGVVNGPAASPLTTYKTSLNGRSLRVYS